MQIALNRVWIEILCYKKTKYLAHIFYFSNYNEFIM